MHLVYRMVLDNVNLVLKSLRLARMVACFHCFSLILMMPSALPIMKRGHPGSQMQDLFNRGSGMACWPFFISVLNKSRMGAVKT